MYFSRVSKRIWEIIYFSEIKFHFGNDVKEKVGKRGSAGRKAREEEGQGLRSCDPSLGREYFEEKNMNRPGGGGPTGGGGSSQQRCVFGAAPVHLLINPSLTLFLVSKVGNIPYDATEEQLTEIFASVGPVVCFRYPSYS